MIVWADGAFVDADSVHVSPFDRGFLLGDGVFETFRVSDGEAQRFGAHHRRLQAAADALAIQLPMNAREIEQAAVGLVTENGLADASVRVTVTRGEGPRGLAPPDPAPVRVLMTSAPVSGKRAPAVLAVSSVRRASGSVSSRHKTLSYTDNIAALADVRRRAPDADDALILDDHGRVSGATTANIFWVTGRDLFTPSTECAIRPGVTREALLDAARAYGGWAIHEVEAPLDALLAADEAFLTNSLVGVRSVAKIIA